MSNENKMKTIRIINIMISISIIITFSCSILRFYTFEKVFELTAIVLIAINIYLSRKIDIKYDYVVLKLKNTDFNIIKDTIFNYLSKNKYSNISLHDTTNYTVYYSTLKKSISYYTVCMIKINNYVKEELDEMINTDFEQIKEELFNSNSIKKGKDLHTIFVLYIDDLTDEVKKYLEMPKHKSWSDYYLYSAIVHDKIYIEYPKKYNKNTKYTELSKLLFESIKDLLEHNDSHNKSGKI